MRPQLTHTAVAATDPDASAAFLAETLGHERPDHVAQFRTVQAGNGVFLDQVW